jgi:hypothetical protein
MNHLCSANPSRKREMRRGRGTDESPMLRRSQAPEVSTLIAYVGPMNRLCPAPGRTDESPLLRGVIHADRLCIPI